MASLAYFEHYHLRRVRRAYMDGAIPLEEYMRVLARYEPGVSEGC